MTFFLLSNNPISEAKNVPKMSIKQAGYTENEVRDLVASDIGKFFPDLKTVATEFSRWEDSSRRVDILAIDRKRNLHVIEFKRDNDAAHAELQALRYAAMLSVLSINDLVQAGLSYRKKKDAAITEESWKTELLDFLGEKNLNEIELPAIPRIVLVSSQFNKEITTTVLWLNEQFGSTEEDEPGMYIMCIEVGVYELGGQRVLHFDQIIPISQAEEYQVKARAKEKDSAKKQAMAKRARTVNLLEVSGKLQVGSQIVLISGAFKTLVNMTPQDRTASFAGNGRFTWSADGQTYDSLNALTRALFEKHGQQMGTIQATQYWRMDSSQHSLADEANALVVTVK
ncbi:hypothetical protein [Limnohabitans sp.]|uniref:hypothetical protein n=1 Tax=Limnohabitans sp. TaxID=1907725 RepID=UPI00334060BD